MNSTEAAGKLVMIQQKYNVCAGDRLFLATTRQFHQHVVFGALKKNQISDLVQSSVPARLAAECLTVKGDVVGWMAAGRVRSMSDNGREEGIDANVNTVKQGAAATPRSG